MRSKIQHTVLESNKLSFAGRTAEAMAFIVRFLNDSKDAFESEPKEFLLLFHHCLKIQSNDPKQASNQDHLNVMSYGTKLQTIGSLVEFADDIYCDRISVTEAINHSFDSDHHFETLAFYQQVMGESYQKAGKFMQAMRCFELAIELDPYWYPAYLNLSQCSHKLGLQRKADHYFFLYEDANPYGMHGNFEHHSDMLEELLFQERYEDATYTIESLSDWWLDNRGFVPAEILVFNNLSLARVSEAESNEKNTKEYLSLAVQEANQAIADENIDPDTLYFIGKMLFEHGVEEKYFEVLTEILTNENRNIEQTDLIQKIASDFVGMDDFKRPIHIIKKAIAIRPENKDLQFCQLILKLKENNHQPEEYLFKKEQLRSLSHKSNSEVEQLQLLHSLNKQFDEDPDVLKKLASIYRSMGSATKASFYFEKLLQINPNSTTYRMDYVDFLLGEHELEEAKKELDNMSVSGAYQKNNSMMQWYKVRLSLLQNGYDEASRIIGPLVSKEPWNVRYLVAEIMSKSALKNIEYEKELSYIAESGQEEIRWEEFDEVTQKVLEDHQYEIAYLRSKLKFIKSKGRAKELRRVTGIAENFMQQRCIGELIKLLNTNFHSGHIHCSIAKLYKNIWLLESSTEWFELAMKENIDQMTEADCFIEIADNKIWQKQDYSKAIELVKAGIELSGTRPTKAMTTLAYARLLNGDTVRARNAISQVDLRADYNATFVAGLIEYRDGLTAKAKEIWKPIITAQSDDLRLHILKKQIREFYYEESPLWKRSVS